MDSIDNTQDQSSPRTHADSLDPSDAGLGVNISNYRSNEMPSLDRHLREEVTDELQPLHTGAAATLPVHHPPPPAPSSNYAATPLSSNSSPHTSYGFPTPRSSRSTSSREALNAIDTAYGHVSSPAPGTPQAARTQPPRPAAAARTPSHAYAPPRRPSQFSLSKADRKSSTSSISRARADAEFRAQSKLYRQRIQQGIAEENAPASPDDYPPSLGYSGESEDEDDTSPGLGDPLDKDMYDADTLLFYGKIDTQPSVEEMRIPENRERLEWHSMLANVLTGDVVSQEKRRLIGTGNQPGGETYKAELWTGVRAKCCGRSLPAQKRMIEDQRVKITAMVEEVIAFEIKGETEVGKTAGQQVEEIMVRIEKIENLYQSTKALNDAHPRSASTDFTHACDAITSWHNTTRLIATQLGVLQSWVGNEELDFSKARTKDAGDDSLADDATFIERILKEDGLKPLQGDTNMLMAIDKVIDKAKQTLIHNAQSFAQRHLPPYIEEMLTLINFPSRLVQEIIRMRLSYTKKMKAEAQQNTLMAEQMISQFRSLLDLAQRIKTQYNGISQPEPGWDLPPCVDENFDSVVLDAIKFYFKMLGSKLSAHRNNFKEAEILEQEWNLISFLGQHFQGSDSAIAERFCGLTSLSLLRLTTHFEKELNRKPEDNIAHDVDRRYRQILDSVRVRQRKLFRFSRLLATTFENACEYSIPNDSEQFQNLWGSLLETGHVMVHITTVENPDIIFIASPQLDGRPRDIAELIETAYQDASEVDLIDPYVLAFNADNVLPWDGASIDVDMLIPKLDVKPGKIRLVSQGVAGALHSAQTVFVETTDLELDVVLAKRANLMSVDNELQRIRRTISKLSNSIMESVEHIRTQLAGLNCNELIQSCYAYATEFGQRSLLYMDHSRRALINEKLTKLGLNWIAFICDDCQASERKTFRWAVVALEFAMLMTRGQNLLTLSDTDYARLREKVSGCMSLLISHFDIMGARSTVAAQAEKARQDAQGNKFKLDISKLKTDEESALMVQQQWMDRLAHIDEMRREREADIKPLGRVLENSTEADRSLMLLSAYATNVTLRWQQGQYIGGGTFGSVYVATNIDSGHLMAVKEIRLQDPQITPKVVNQIRDEMNVLQILSHDNIVSYHGIEVHRDKVYIFMEYCSGGSLANLLEHGRIEDETVMKVYGLQLLEGLAYLHDSNVIHRDIKPENILLDHNGVIKYVDFGAAKIIARQTGRTLGPNSEARGALQRSMTGTPMYMSPEVIRGSSAVASAGGGGGGSGSSSSGSGSSNAGGTLSAGASAPPSPSSPNARPGAADIWSLGCVMLEMATGRRPWASLDNEWAIMYNIANGNAPALPTRDQLSEAGIDFLRKCFDRDPMRRASAAELLQHDWIMQLRNVLNLEATPVTPGSDGAGSSFSRQDTGLSSSSASNGSASGSASGSTSA